MLRVSFWSAALADFAIAALVWMPERMGVAETVYPMGLVSVIAFSWGVLLVMADRRPMERKWVLLPTMLVVLLIAVMRTLFSMGGELQFSITILLFAMALIVLMGYSYYCASRYDNRD